MKRKVYAARTAKDVYTVTADQKAAAASRRRYKQPKLA